MKLAYAFFTCCLLGFLFLNNASGPGSVQGIDRTGGPLSPNFCVECHSDGEFSPGISLALLRGGEVVNNYVPGTEHQLRVTIGNQGASRFGFQAVALTGTGNVSAGNFMATAGTQTVNINGRQYIEHSSPRTSNVITVNWTAPASGTGDVRFYSAGIAANGNGSNDGDGAARLNPPLTVTELTTDVQTVKPLATAILVLPNPVKDQMTVRLEMTEAAEAVVRLIDAACHTLRTSRHRLTAGRNDLSWSATDLPTGHYWLEVSDGRRRSLATLVKE